MIKIYISVVIFSRVNWTSYMYYTKWKYYYFNEKIWQKFRLKNIYDIRSYFIEKIKKIYTLSKRNEKVCADLNFIGNLRILAHVLTECVSVFAFAPWVRIFIDIVNFAVWLKIVW